MEMYEDSMAREARQRIETILHEAQSTQLAVEAAEGAECNVPLAGARREVARLLIRIARAVEPAPSAREGYAPRASDVA
jgi:hypothetical protein